jgi:multiple sugar transport system substrate-binding protein
MIELKGITWDHSRGFTPLVACCQRYHEQHPYMDVQWYKRSLQSFADFPVETLANDYDLLIIDHPFVGEAYYSGCFVHLDNHIDNTFLDDQLNNSTGLSYQSYAYNGAQLALPVDAATPVSCYRKDLLEQHNESIPQTWQELLLLAEKGRIAMPAIPVDILMNFYMFCIAYGHQPFVSNNEVVNEQAGLQALHRMDELYSYLDKIMFSCNPIAVAEIMSSTDNYWYCPFTYGYSNYARNNYANKLLTYDDIISYNGTKLSSTLGGTGIAVSAYSKHIDLAIEVACMLASAAVQCGRYVETGGQPAYLQAWKSKEVNGLCNNFFSNTLPALQRSYLRPRYKGYLQFQHAAGKVLHDFLKKREMNQKTVLARLNNLYRTSLPTYDNTVTT